MLLFCPHLSIESFNLFQSSVAFHIETNHLICYANQLTGFFEYIQLTFTCSKSTIETLEKGVKYVQN